MMHIPWGTTHYENARYGKSICTAYIYITYRVASL